MSSCGHREPVTSNATLNSGGTDDCTGYWRKHMFLPIVDSLMGELQRRFMSDESLSLSKAVSSVFDLNYDGLTGLLETYEKVCNIDRQLLKAEMKTFKSDATVSNILNPEHAPIMSEELIYNRIQICRLLCDLH